MIDALNPTQIAFIAGQFAVGAPIQSVQAHGKGLINDTYLVTLAADPPRQIILQRVNTRVFRHPESIMDNLREVSAHAARQRAASRLVFPDVFGTPDGVPYVRDAGGGFWRAQQFIPNGHTLHALTDLAQARELGAALGAFHALVGAVPCARLHTTLPGFHILPGYLERYDVAVARGAHESSPRLDACMTFVEQHRDAATTLEDAKQRGELHERATHGDPKIDNFLFDAAQRAISLIDLDTVQPGLIHYDIGDLIRSACNRAGEGAQAARVAFDLPACTAILDGYVESARALLTDADFTYLYPAIRLIPFELGLRFLTDHLDGDTYFKTTHRGQNMERAEVQFELTRRIEDAETELQHVIARLAAAR